MHDLDRISTETDMTTQVGGFLLASVLDRAEGQ